MAPLCITIKTLFNFIYALHLVVSLSNDTSRISISNVQLELEARASYLITTTYPLELNESIIVIDLIAYNGEKMGFFRFNYLKDVVNLFVIIEANITYSGRKKANFYLDDDEKALADIRKLNKTLEVKVLNIPMPKNFAYFSEKGRNHKYDMAWNREEFVRNVGLSIVLYSLPPQQRFILLVADCDEIPRREMFSKLRDQYEILKSGLALQMLNCIYSFKWVQYFRQIRIWTRAYVITDQSGELLKKYKTLDKLRSISEFKLPLYANAGWHCSFCMQVDDIVRKIKSFSHLEFDLPSFTNKQWVSQRVSSGKDIFNRPAKQYFIALNDCSQGSPNLNNLLLGELDFLNFNHCDKNQPTVNMTLLVDASNVKKTRNNRNSPQQYNITPGGPERVEKARREKERISSRQNSGRGKGKISSRQFLLKSRELV